VESLTHAAARKVDSEGRGAEASWKAAVHPFVLRCVEAQSEPLVMSTAPVARPSVGPSPVSSSAVNEQPSNTSGSSLAPALATSAAKLVVASVAAGDGEPHVLVPAAAAGTGATRKAKREKKKKEKLPLTVELIGAGWEEVVDDDDGSVYYHNARSGSTQWEFPSSA
jgi:hypothetical protein